MLLLIYTWLALLTALCIGIPVLIMQIIDLSKDGEEKTKIADLVCVIIALVMVTILFIILIVFINFHQELISTNSSTIENLEEQKSGPAFVSYDMGSEFNWAQVMGKNKCLWPIPYCGDAGKPNGDGVVFPKKESGLKDSGYELQDYDDEEDNNNKEDFDNPLADYAQKNYYGKSTIGGTYPNPGNSRGGPTGNNPLVNGQSGAYGNNSNMMNSQSQPLGYSGAYGGGGGIQNNLNKAPGGYIGSNVNSNARTGGGSNTGPGYAWGNENRGNLGKSNPLSPLSFNYN